ncbi:probable methyltransferase-like protein 15 [Galendromus occidentalis]|uniref:Probable methyltransferase-like protein 15 n=1 Tax=Galendromus occidentalis TaxID=34638 RepID=A0AAJ6QNY9_9ACAR|nr:probable methyltransferase-like protein 15 [Galendromus occidentalis]
MLKNLRLALSTPVSRFTRGHSTLQENVKAEKPLHTSVLLKESIDALLIEEDKTYVDMTFGAGGHTRAMLEQGARVVAIDRDPSVSELADEVKEEYKDRFDFGVSKFTDVRDVLSRHCVKMGSVSGVLIDCGFSSMQMDQPRGFSISKDGPLDMRMNPAEKDCPTAAALVNVLDAESLARIFKVYGGERNARKIAEAIVSYRYEMKRMRTTRELSEVVEAAFSEGHERRDSLGRFTSLATKIFMALRIFVNDELNELNRALYLSHQMLVPYGRAAVISFHSLEDRIVKRHFQGIDLDEPASQSISQKYKNSTAWHSEAEIVKTWIPIPKFIAPSPDEVERNPRSRSAKLRVAEKIDSSK